MSEEGVEISRSDIIIPKGRKELEEKLFSLCKEYKVKIIANDLMNWLGFLACLEDYMNKFYKNKQGAKNDINR